MKKLMSVLAVSVAALSFSATPAFAGEQQERMKACNVDAGAMKGPERRVFMKDCLTKKKIAQQEKMKVCNADDKAKTLRGDARKAFMKECLSAH